ncbi:ferritin-like domain-containing protein [Patulibacter brassicae]|jgi:rubrerythrin|uniref:Ferritin-like domain-containing protein n=1 Tax=Patulibacter brassicae TaxID=1705717 RepID=A0ABU4VJ77_9ACTN|nr:ferritin-like domain-containing protein [Patulibacter brassicae]MDX8150963.1 ferritin-like domain-containing protein [Patulibacter brassicae]
MRTNELPTANAGAIDAIEVVGHTRQAFLLKATLAAAATAGAAMLGPNVSRALAQSDMGDVEILNYALTLEYLEADFYKQGRKLSLNDETMGIARVFGREEAEHVDALKKTIQQLGGTPVEEPTFTFPITNQASFIKLAMTLEDTGVSAYNGAATGIKSKEVLGAAGSIVQVEARHAAVIRLLNDKPPAPRDFDVASEKDAVVKAITPLIAKG